MDAGREAHAQRRLAAFGVHATGRAERGALLGYRREHTVEAPCYVRIPVWKLRRVHVAVWRGIHERRVEGESDVCCVTWAVPWRRGWRRGGGRRRGWRRCGWRRRRWR
jgi:hypothetical protein